MYWNLKLELVQAIVFAQVLVFAQELVFADVLFAGYRIASVIIALTDGELRETQFDLAAREVSYWHSCFLKR